MDGYELNKYFGAIVGAGCVYLTISILSEAVFSKGHHHGDDHKLAYALEIEGAEDVAGDDEEPAVVVSLASLVASADSGAGARVFKKCQGCHNVDEGGRNGVGPALHGVMGRQIASHDGFAYSGALADKGGAWTWEAMNAFLENPKGWAPGTKMSFAGLRKAEDRAAVMLYMNENSGAPIDPPAAEDAAAAPSEPDNG